jgi:hypothetical protein
MDTSLTHPKYYIFVLQAKPLISHHGGGLISQDELCTVERAEMTKALEEPTRCIEDAEPADGAFPLIVHHGGFGSSFEDNAALSVLHGTDAQRSQPLEIFCTARSYCPNSCTAMWCFATR